MKYDHEFYEEHLPGVQRSAKVVVPLLIDTVRPSSVVDVGSGIGGWLEAFVGLGIRT